MSADFVIRGAMLYDGLGTPGRMADVAIRDGRVAQIGTIGPTDRVVDAAGLALMPGIVDLHTH